MAQITIEQLLQLSKNPHYKMSEEESRQLKESQKRSNVKNKNVVNKHETQPEKHSPEMDSVQPQTEYAGGPNK